MSTDTIENRLKKMIVERLFMKITPDQLDADKSLINDYGVDSVSLLELVVGLEDEFGLAIGDKEFKVANFENVAALAAFVRSKQGVG